MERHMEKAAGGDAEAFIWLMEENKHMLYKIAKGYLRREEDIVRYRKRCWLHLSI